MRDVVVVIGPGQIGQAIVRRVGVGKHVLLADMRPDNANAAAERSEARSIRSMRSIKRSISAFNSTGTSGPFRSRAWELVDEHGDPALEHGQDPAVGAPLRVIQLGAEGADFFRQFRQRLRRRGLGGDAAHRDNGACKLLEDRWVPSARDNLNLARGLLHHARHAEEAFSRP